MEDIDLCRMLNNILENAVEGCKKVSGERRFIRLNLHSKENFLFVKCENGCDEGSLRAVSYTHLVMELRAICQKEQSTLWDESRRFSNPQKVYVDLSPKLFEVKRELIEEMSRKDLEFEEE